MNTRLAHAVRDRVQAKCTADPKLAEAIAAGWLMANRLILNAGANHGQVQAARLAFLIEIDAGKLPSQAYQAAVAPYVQEQPQ